MISPRAFLVGLFATAAALGAVAAYLTGTLNAYRAEQARFSDLEGVDRSFRFAAGADSRSSLLPRSSDHLNWRLGVDPENHDQIDYRLAPLGPEPRPEDMVITLCRHVCTSESGGTIDMRLAYAIHEDREGGTDSFGFVFAPERRGSFTGDRLRFVYSANSGGIFGMPDSWGVTPGPWRGGTEVTDALGRLYGFGDTKYASVLDEKTSASGIRWANNEGLPADSLVLNSEFGERVSFVGGSELDRFVRWIAPEGRLDLGRLALLMELVTFALSILGFLFSMAIRVGRAMERLETSARSA